MKLKNQMEKDLSNIILPEDFNQKVWKQIQYKRKKTRKIFAAVFFCVLIVGGTVSAHFIYQQVLVNHEELPPVNDMEIRVVNDSDAEPDAYGFYEETYYSYQSLCDDLGITLLNSSLAENNPYMIIKRDTDNDNWNIIKINAYIIGDLPKLTLLPNGKDYTWEQGDIYSSPVDMEIHIISTERQLKNEFNMEFLGYYDYVETYTAKGGFLVNILQDTTIKENESLKIKPIYTGIFVYDGIRYVLTGQMNLETFKKVIDSFN